MGKKLLVALHPGFTSTPAIKRACTLSAAMESKVMLYSVVYDEYIPGLAVSKSEMQTMRDSILESEHRKLEQVKEELENIAASVTVLAEWQASIAESIANTAKRIDADLILVSSTRHSMVSRLFLSNTDWEILRCASKPVLFAHHQPEKPYKKVMIAIDPVHEHDKPAELDNRLIATGKWISEVFAGEYCLAHAYPSLRSELAMDYIIPYEMSEQWKQTHQDAVFKLAEKHHIASDKIHFLDEHPADAIPELARLVKADLVVMGVVSRSSSEQASIGNTAEHVLDRLECDVLTVPVDDSMK